MIELLILHLCADCQASGAKPVYEGVGDQWDQCQRRKCSNNAYGYAGAVSGAFMHTPVFSSMLMEQSLKCLLHM